MPNKPIPSSDAPVFQTLSREDFWQQHICQWRDSGLSKMAYCQQYSLVYHQMVYWCTRAAKKSIDTRSPTNDFIPVSVTSTVEHSGLHVRLPSGVTIDGIDERSLALVVKLVEQL